jgi:transcriptional regulator with XRE-family HTH domain
MLRLSQQNLGHKLGITFQQVQKYEKGTNRVSASRLQALSNILQVPVPFFFDGVGGVPAAAERLRRPHMSWIFSPAPAG